MRTSQRTFLPRLVQIGQTVLEMFKEIVEDACWVMRHHHPKAPLEHVVLGRAKKVTQILKFDFGSVDSILEKE